MNEKRICIVTNYGTTTNYGALLQAYALNQVINNMGYHPQNLYIENDSKSKGKKLLRQLTHFQFKEIKNEISNRIQRNKVKNHLDTRKKVMDEFRFNIPHTEKYSRDNLKSLQQAYDVFICGSDQIFRPNKLTGELEEHFFLGMVTDNSVKASYAASIGIASYDNKNEKKASGYLSSFDKISIREKKSADYIRQITGRDDIIASIDPVFLIKREEWLNNSKPYDINEKYILVYMIHGTELLYKSIKDFSAKSGLKIVTFPSMSYKRKSYEKNFADVEILDAAPFQFISLINNAQYIFTDSFHGTAFSLILHKPAFVSTANEVAFTRIENILNITQTLNLIIPSEGLAPDKYFDKPEIDWKSVDNAISEERAQSLNYLQEVINLNK